MLANFIKESVSVGGTGNITLGGAVSGFASFSSSFATGQSFYYAIEDGTSRESGIGHLSAATTLVRDKILETLSGGTLTTQGATALNISTSGLVFVGDSADAVVATASAGIGGQVTNGFHQANGDGKTEANGSAAAVDRVTYMPYLVPTECVVSSIGFNVSILASSATVEAGIYDISSSGFPGQLLATSGKLSASTTGFKSGSLVTPLRLYPGWYVGAFVADGTTNPSLTGIAQGNVWSPGGAGTGTWNYVRFRSDNTHTSLPATGDTTSIVDESASPPLKIFIIPK